MAMAIEHHQKATDELKPAPQFQSKTWVCGLALGLTMFALYYSLTIRFDQLKIFEQPNILFHADPMWRIRSFSHGWGWSDRNLVHPNLGTFFSLPIRAVAKLSVWSGIYDGSEEDLRRFLATFLVPLFAAATVTIVYFSLHLAGLRIWQSLLVALIGGCSFSQLIFGSIPDHFAIGGFCIAGGVLLSVDMLRNEGRIRWPAWTVLGIFTVGITSTNIMWVGLLFCFSMYYVRRDWKVVLKTMVIWIFLIIPVTVLVAEMGKRLYDQDDQIWSMSQLTTYKEDVNEEGIFKLASAPATVANTFSPSNLDTTENPAADDYGGRSYMFTLENSHGIIPVLLVSALIILGTVGWIWEKSVFRVLGVACVLILLLNLLMHALAGSEYFSFSQHWLIPALILMAGNFRLPSRYKVVGICGLVTMAVLMILNNIWFINELTLKLASDLT